MAEKGYTMSVELKKIHVVLAIIVMVASGFVGTFGAIITREVEYSHIKDDVESTISGLEYVHEELKAINLEQNQQNLKINKKPDMADVQKYVDQQMKSVNQHTDDVVAGLKELIRTEFKNVRSDINEIKQAQRN